MASTWFKSATRAVATSAMVVSALGLTATVAGAETHEVKPGETLSEIARDFGVSTEELMEANGITDPDRVRSGQILEVPSSTYTVRQGDTLFSISQKLGIHYVELAEYNGINNPNRIVVGQVLMTSPSTLEQVEQAQESAQAQPASKPVHQLAIDADGRATHTVVAGETITSIARQHNMSKSRLIQLNALGTGNQLAAGDVLLLPNWIVNKPAAAKNSGASNTATSAPNNSTPNSSSTPNNRVSIKIDTSNAPSAAAVLEAYPNMPPSIVGDPARRALIPTFEKWANENNLPVELVMAVAWQESNWRAGAISSAGAFGIGQIMPATEKWLVKDVIGDKSLKAEDPHQNIQMSARYLRWLHEYLGTTDLALAGYFQGPGATIRDEWADATDGYVTSVKAHRKLFVPAGR